LKELRYFFSGAYTIGLSSVFSLLTPIIVIPYLIKTVGISNYGLSIVVFSISMILSIVIDFGFNITGVNRITKDRSKNNVIKTVISITFCKTFLFTVVLAASGLAFFLIQGIRSYFVLFMYSLAIPFSSIFNFNWALQGLEKLKLLALITVLGKAIYLGLVFCLIIEPKDYIYINGCFGIGIIIAGFFAGRLILKEYPINDKVTLQKSLIIEEFRSSYHYFISNISIYFSSFLFPVIVGMFTNIEMAGIYSIVEKVYNFSRAIFSIYQTIMFPRISNLIEGSVSSAKKAVKNTYAFVVLFVIFEAIIIFVFNQQIVQYFTTEHIDLTKKLLNMSAFALLFVAVNCPFYLLAIASDMKEKIMNTFFVLSLIAVFCCCILVYLFGLFGALWALIFTEALYSVLMIIIWRTRK